jgi:hypothetical protein
MATSAATEQDMGAWFAEQARRATGPREDELAAVIEAMREAIGAEAADAILARAGVRAPNRSPNPQKFPD